LPFGLWRSVWRALDLQDLPCCSTR
jgi:hypothetical protein